MRKSIREACLAAVNYTSTPSLGLAGRRYTSPSVSKFKQNDSLHISKEITRAGIQAINIDRKYSILSVPKTPSRPLTISRNTEITQNQKLHTSDSSIMPARDFNRLATAKEELPKSIFPPRLTRISSGYRYRKNPNQENLKNALIEIEKNPLNKLVPREQLKQKCNDIFVPTVQNKSDIEVLLESQGCVQRKKSYIKPRTAKNLEDVEKLETMIDEKEDLKSQRSDPSPVRERKVFNDDCRSQTPKKRKKFPKPRDHKLKFSKKSNKDLLNKYPTRNDALSFISKEKSYSHLENFNQSFLDYRQESLKILKDTSFFANNIMKSIRCPGRVKKCYY